jgi:hypothetical protein
MDADGLMFLLIFFFAATVILLIALILERRVERTRDDWIAHRHRRIKAAGFKSRMGVRQ